MSHKLAIMFDLENTCITSWDNPQPIDEKINFIKKSLENYKNVCFDIKYGIFSYAIDHEFEKDKAIKIIEDIFPDIKIDKDLVPYFDELMEKFGNNYIMKNELISILGKELMFQKWTQNYGCDFVLFDDMLSSQSCLITRKISNRTFYDIHMIRV